MAVIFKHFLMGFWGKEKSVFLFPGIFFYIFHTQKSNGFLYLKKKKENKFELKT